MIDYNLILYIGLGLIIGGFCLFLYSEHRIRQIDMELARQKKLHQAFINGKVDSSLYYAGEYIYFLQDSLEILKQNTNTISAQNIELKLHNHNYKDSLNTLILERKINSDTQNTAMRHLSKSLRLYYQGYFKEALQEVDKAIELQPNIAVAYARKGSIYYKLNQLDRATLNWNIALKLDPEYDEVRSVLLDVKDNTKVSIEKLPE